jgi:hypothetical protein
MRECESEYAYVSRRTHPHGTPLPSCLELIGSRRSRRHPTREATSGEQESES